MLGGWVKERASSLARLDRFDVSRLCVDKVDYTAGDTPPTGAGTTRVYSRSLSGPSVLQIQILIWRWPESTVCVLPYTSVYSDTFLS